MENLTLFGPEKNSVKTLEKQTNSSTHTHASVKLIKSATNLLAVFDIIEADSKLKRDKMVDENYVRLTPDLKAFKYKFTRNGLSTLNDFTDIPNAMLEYLYNKQYFSDYADYCNAELDRRANKKRVCKKFLIRFRKINGEEHIRGVLSSRYGIIDHIDVMKAVVKGLPGSGKLDSKVTNYSYDGDNLIVNTLMPDYIKDDENNEYSCGVAIGNSEVKAKTFSIHPYVYRHADGTGYLWGKRDLVLSVNQKHVGKIESSKIEALTAGGIKASLSMGKSLVVLFDYAKKIQVTNAARVIASLCREYKISIPMGKKINEAYLTSKYKNKAFGIINAVSKAALEYEGVEREYLERVATQMLATSLDTTKELMQKRWENIESKSYLLDAKTVALYEHKGV